MAIEITFGRELLLIVVYAGNKMRLHQESFSLRHGKLAGRSFCLYTARSRFVIVQSNSTH